MSLAKTKQDKTNKISILSEHMTTSSAISGERRFSPQNSAVNSFTAQLNLDPLYNSSENVIVMNASL